jgi:hypothetical protein
VATGAAIGGAGGESVFQGSHAKGLAAAPTVAAPHISDEKFKHEEPTNADPG